MFGTAVSIFVAQRIEYLGLEYMNFAGALALGAVVGTTVLAILAVRMFMHAGAVAVALAAGCFAGLPFLIDWLLRLNGTQLNVHGFAILGYFVYLLGSEACAIGLVIALVVRSAMRWKSRHAV